MTPIVITLALLMLQTTVLKMYGWMAPDMALIAALYCGRKYGKHRGYRLGIALGVAQDLFSFGILGINLFSKGLIGLVSGLIRESNLFDPRSMNTWIIVIFIATTANELIGMLYSSGLFGTTTTVAATIWTIVTQSLINLIAGLLMIFIMDRIVSRIKTPAGVQGSV